MLSIQIPSTQIQEVLYLLIHTDRITRAIGISQGIWNLPARVFDLRAKGVDIISETTTGNNKFGRPVKWVNYKLANKHEAIVYYNNLVKQESNTEV